MGGGYAEKATVCKILQPGIWWPTMHVDARDYCCSCDVFQRTRKPSRRDEMPLVPQITLQAFDKWVVDFVGPISPAGKCTRARYIITMRDYLTLLVEAVPVKDCTIVMESIFLFKTILTRFGCPKILINDQGMHFFNQLIEELRDEF